jgi:uncharacterized repeat protein (TIGR04052 family)
MIASQPCCFWVAASIGLLSVQACGDDDDTHASSAAETTDAGRQAPKPAGEAGAGGRKPAQAGNQAAGTASAPQAGAVAPEHDTDAGTDDGLRQVDIRFLGLVGGRALHCGESYDGQGASRQRITPHDFRFFVQEVRLTRVSGPALAVSFDERATVQTKDVALIDFTDQSGQCSAGDGTMNVHVTGRVPAGETTGIELVLGVPETLNHQAFTSARAPLNDPSTYWGWSNGYRFVLAALDTEPDSQTLAADGGANVPGLSLVHIGSGGCTGKNATGYTCSRPNRAHIVLDHFDPEQDVISADLGEVFRGVDLRQALECHGLEPGCETAFAAFGLNADGQAMDAQHVFGVQRAP